MYIYFKMKKFLFSILFLLVFFVMWCWNSVENVNNQGDLDDDIQSNIDETLKTIVHNHESCDSDGEMFVDIAVLWSLEKDNWNVEYYLLANGECFRIDERWNLSDEGGFGGVPTTIELWENENGYSLVKYETAKDGNEYDSSTKEMFSDEAYKIRKDAKYKFINDKSLLEQAEEYFGVRIIPKNENKFECSFCDKLRYYEPPETEDWKSSDLIFNYVSYNNWNDTIYFGSDWGFEAKGSWDEWKCTRTFGQDKNTIIVLNNNSDHVYNRYIITNQTESSLNTILEIIQRR